MRWQKGRSGNPAGRPPGARSRRTLVQEALVALAAERIAGDLARRARAGEPPALRVLARWRREQMRDPE